MADEDKYERLRREMTHGQIESRGIRDPRILAAFNRVPRHLFMEESMRHKAYEDYPLPIGEGQTISQPYTVAFMTDALDLKGDEKVLEVGAGSGYQTAILLELVKRVYAIERLPNLALLAKNNLEQLGYAGFEITVGDGSLGWPDKSPFDAILVAAGSPKVPRPLMDQLSLGGRLVIPVGDRTNQMMTRITRTGEIEYKQDDLGGFRFVGLIGEEGWDS